MENIHIGEIALSPIIAGVMRLNEWGMSADELGDWIKACIDLGITTFDHADIYGSYTCESLFGSALAGRSYLRQKMQIVTKCGISLLSKQRPDHHIKHYNTSYEHIIASVEQSLQNLHTDYIDLLLIHRPDPLMDADEVADAFMVLAEAGKVLAFGVSNFSNTQYSLLDSRLEDFDLVTNQIEFSVLHTQALYDGTLDWCQMLDIPPMIWSPLAGGAIFSPHDERSQRVHDTLEAIGARHGASLDQIALAWVLMHPSQPLAVLGTGKLERLKAALGALEIELERQEWFEILRSSQGEDVP